jgi:hypothetical protein
VPGLAGQLGHQNPVGISPGTILVHESGRSRAGCPGPAEPCRPSRTQRRLSGWRP